VIGTDGPEGVYQICVAVGEDSTAKVDKAVAKEAFVARMLSYVEIV
jgi:hypothetical protein